MHIIDDKNEEDQQHLLALSTTRSARLGRKRHTKRSQRYILGLVSLYVGGLMLISICSALVYNSWSQRQEQSPGPFGNCGSSPAEARRLGCQFDVVSYAWLPPACYDTELVKEFLSLKEWVWYYNVVGKHAVPKEEVLKGELDGLIVTREYHKFHCTYQWRKMHRGLQNRIIDTYIGEFRHTTHCEMMLTEEVAPNKTDTILMMKFAQCQRI
jgi:hypothetical protein